MLELIAARIFLLLGFFFLTLLFFFLYEFVRQHNHNTERKKLWDRREKKWTPLVQKYLEDKLSADDVHAVISPKQRLEFCDFLLKLHKRSSTLDQKELISRLSKPYLTQIAAKSSSKEPEVRARVYHTLGILAPHDFTGTLEKGAGDAVPYVAICAIKGLAHIAHPKTVRLVFDRIEEFSLWSADFLVGLAASSGRAAVGFLEQKMGDESLDTLARKATLRTLIQVDKKRGLAVSRRILSASTERELAILALKTIGLHGEATDRETIAPYLTFEDNILRMYAAEALGRTSHELSDVRLLDRLLEDKSEWVVFHAAKALSRIRERGETATGENVNGENGNGEKVNGELETLESMSERNLIKEICSRGVPAFYQPASKEREA